MNESTNECSEPFSTSNGYIYETFVLLSVSQVVLGAVSIPTNLVLIVSLCRHSFWSKEFRFLLANLSFFNVFLAIGMLQHVFTFEIRVLLGSASSFSMLAIKCQLHHLIGNVAGTGSILSLSVVGVERVLMTKDALRGTYSVRKYVTYSVLVCTFGIIFSVMFCLVATYLFIPNTVVCYCFFATSFPKVISYGFYPFYLLIVVCIGCLVYYSLQKNRKKFGEFAINRAIVQSLNQRHRLLENIKIR